MQVEVKAKKVGAKEWESTKINLPDSTAPFFERYNLELIEHPTCLCLYFQKKDVAEIDVVSYTINNHTHPDNMVDGFRDAFSKLKQLEANEYKEALDYNPT
jgi:hypothetical protein